DEKVGDWAYDRNDDLIPEKVDMIARAWLDGYEIKQEKLYTVEIPVWIFIISMIGLFLKEVKTTPKSKEEVE
ncbi:TPA: DUF1642 domain-containing protein, partial [Streptococcus suis]|nr:DUF1642 domain-containing protein [Streptococcus suis]HEM6327464.1 DUF1642 domain-containing protein [Streptococcus suis]